MHRLHITDELGATRDTLGKSRSEDTLSHIGDKIGHHVFLSPHDPVCVLELVIILGESSIV
jgi:hypothetical protein